MRNENVNKLQNQQSCQNAVSGSVIDVLKWIADCPYNIDEDTIPKKGIDSNPEQVVLNISISYTKWEKLQNVVKNYR